MAELTVQAISKTGLDVSASLAAADVAGDVVQVSQRLMFVVANADAAPHTVTIVSPVTDTSSNYGKLPVTDLVVNVATGETISFSIPNGYAVDGNFNLTYDDVTSVTVGVFVINPDA